MSLLKSKKEKKKIVKKHLLLAEKYTVSTLHECFERLLRISMAIPQGKGPYTCEYLAARCSIHPEIIRDIMQVMVHMGVYKQSKDDPEYYELKGGKLTYPG